MPSLTSVIKQASRGADLYFVFRFLRLLTMKWTRTDAYKYKIIDKKGNALRKSSELESVNEKAAYTMLHRMVFKIRRLIEKVPLIGKSILLNYAAALFLLKEQKDTRIWTDEKYMARKLMEFLETDWSADAKFLQEEIKNKYGKTSASEFLVEEVEIDEKRKAAKDVGMECQECGKRFRSKNPRYGVTKCPKCKSTDIDVSFGEEVEIDEGTVLDVKDTDKWIKEIEKGIDAPWIQVRKSTLGGDENVAIMIKLSLDAEKDWNNKILHNSRYAMISLGANGNLEMFAKGRQMKNMRKTKIKSAKDAIGKINTWIKKVDEEVVVDEVAPPGWEGTVKAMKKKKGIDNPWALAWYMHNKGDKPHVPEGNELEEMQMENTEKKILNFGEFKLNEISMESGKVYHQDTSDGPIYFKAVERQKNKRWKGLVLDIGQRKPKNGSTDEKLRFWQATPDKDVPPSLKEEVELEEEVSEKDYDSLKRGDIITIEYKGAMSSGKSSFKVTAKNIVGKAKVGKVTLQSTKNPKGVKHFLYKRGNKVSFAQGDMAASVVKYTVEEVDLDEMPNRANMEKINSLIKKHSGKFKWRDEVLYVDKGIEKDVASLIKRGGLTATIKVSSNPMREEIELTEVLKSKDKSVIDAFYDKDSLVGRLLSTNGRSLQKHGMGGQTIAAWLKDKIAIIAVSDVKSTDEILRYMKNSIPKLTFDPKSYKKFFEEVEYIDEEVFNWYIIKGNKEKGKVAHVGTERQLKLKIRKPTFPPNHVLAKSRKDLRIGDKWKGSMGVSEEMVDEEIPTTSTTGVAGLDTGLTFAKKKEDEKKAKLLRKKLIGEIKMTKFAGKDVFIVDSDIYHACRLGKKQYARYETYVGNDTIGLAIREFGLKFPRRPIILQNGENGPMLYLKYGRS